MLWIDGWSDLYDALEQLPSGQLVNEDWQEVTLEECKSTIQSAAYTLGQRARFRKTFYRGKPALQLVFV